MGPEYVKGETFNLAEIYKDSSPEQCLIFILSPGSDPLSDVFKLAEQESKSSDVDILSLG